MPPTPCTPKTSSESSAPSIFFRPLTPHKQTKPAIPPTIIPPIKPTLPQAGVIATNPATAPDAAPTIEALPFRTASPIDHVRAAAAVARERIDECEYCGVACFQSRAGIEAEPAHPTTATHRPSSRSPSAE